MLEDTFFKKAKAQGYVARSAYKLQEIQQKHKLIPQGGQVLDLGCHPGAWLQVRASSREQDSCPHWALAGIATTTGQSTMLHTAAAACPLCAPRAPGVTPPSLLLRLVAAGCLRVAWAGEERRPRDWRGPAGKCCCGEKAWMHAMPSPGAASVVWAPQAAALVAQRACECCIPGIVPSCCHPQ